MNRTSKSSKTNKLAEIRKADKWSDQLNIFVYLIPIQMLTLFSDESYMREAIKEARKALAENEIPIGAVIVCDNRIIARAHNLTERLNDVTAHAEMQAFTAAANFLGGKYLTDCSLYVTIEPCPMCAGASFWTQINRVVFGAIDNKRGYSKLGATMLHPRTKVTSGVMEEECAQLMRDFFKRKRQKSMY